MPRQSDAGSNGDIKKVLNRSVTTQREAHAAVKELRQREAGMAISAEDLSAFCNARLFWHRNGVAFCTYPAFAGPRVCFHSLALDLLAGNVELPPEMDATQVDLARRGGGSKRKAADRGSPPPLSARTDELGQLVESLEHR